MMDSPFTGPGKDTTPGTSSMSTSPGAVPGPAGDYPFPLVIDLPASVNVPTDSPFSEVIATSINTVKSGDPGGSAPISSPFTDKFGKDL